MNRLNFEQEKQLIDYFRDNPSLWNTKDKDYNNRMMRTQKLETIANSLQLTRKDVYEKYRNLRTTFFREHKRVEQSISNGGGKNGGHNSGDQASGSGGGALAYVSKWRHYQNMLFLTKVDKSLGAISRSDGLGSLNHTNNGNSLHNEDSNVSNDAPPPGGALPNATNNSSQQPHLNNGHDIELVIDTEHRTAPDNTGRSVAMDTSGDNTTTTTNTNNATNNGDAATNSTALVGAPAASFLVQTGAGNSAVTGNVVPSSLVNHTQLTTSHPDQQELIYFTQDGSIVNTTRIMTSNATSINRPTGGTLVSVPALHPNPPSAHSVIYASQLAVATANNNTGVRTVCKTEDATDLRHLATAATAANNSHILVPMQPAFLNPRQLHMTADWRLASSGIALGPAVSAVSAPTAAATNLVVSGTKTSAASAALLQSTTAAAAASKSTSQQPVLAQAVSVAPLAQSTPIPRKGSSLFTTRSQDASPVVSSQSAAPSLAHQVDAAVAALNSDPSVLAGSPSSAFMQLTPAGATAHLTAAAAHSLVNHNLTTAHHQHGQFAISLPVNNSANTSGNSSGIHSASKSSSTILSGLSHTNGGSGSPTAFGAKLMSMDLNEMRELIKQVMAENEDEDMAFARSLAASLRTLDRPNKEVAKLELQQVIVRHTNPNYCASNTNNGGGGTSNYHHVNNADEEHGGASCNASSRTNNHSSSNTVTTIVTSSNNIQTRSK